MHRSNIFTQNTFIKWTFLLDMFIKINSDGLLKKKVRLSVRKNPGEGVAFIIEKVKWIHLVIEL